MGDVIRQGCEISVHATDEIANGWSLMVFSTPW